MSLRVLLTGASGQLGHDLHRRLAGAGHEVVGPDTGQLDLADRDSVLQALCSSEPDVVVHAGAWTAVDACEDDPDRAFRVNALGTRHVQHGARIVGARVCYLSTDYVFDGAASAPYDEWAPVNPVSVYGRSKLGGERELDPGALVVRCSWLCGAHGANFVKTMLRLGAGTDDIRVVDDQFGCPTFTEDLAGAVMGMVTARLTGLYHVTNQGQASWYELASAVFEAAGLPGDRIRPVPTTEYPTRARRPAYSVLDNAALRLQGLPLLPPWQESLERLVKELSR